MQNRRLLYGVFFGQGSRPLACHGCTGRALPGLYAERTGYRLSAYSPGSALPHSGATALPEENSYRNLANNVLARFRHRMNIRKAENVAQSSAALRSAQSVKSQRCSYNSSQESRAQARATLLCNELRFRLHRRCTRGRLTYPAIPSKVASVLNCSRATQRYVLHDPGIAWKCTPH